MRLLFWDVDTQYDFMRADGKLYVPGSEEIIPQLARLTDAAHVAGVRILATADDHVPGHRELADKPDFKDTFPPHCMRGTPGQRKIDETELSEPLVIEPDPIEPARLREQITQHRGDLLFHKHWFDAFSNPNLAPALETLAPERIVLYGVALDVCNRYAIEGLLAHFPRVELHAVTDATRPIDATRTSELVRGWEQRGVKLIDTEEGIELARAATAAGRHA